jgi:8-oxo-dGTP pyrophosphatase MutT (NUDIX family)
MDAVLHQAGAIAYRVRDAQLEVLLITSRGTGRWIIPKGNIDPGLTPAEAAKREAYEEAGVQGATASTLPLGFYTYFKRTASGALCPATVEVYLLHADEQLKRWPEKRKRRLSWKSVEDAIDLVEETGVVPLLRRLAELKGGLVGSDDALVEAAPSDDFR